VNPANIPDDAFFGLSIGEAAKKYLGIVKRKPSIGEIADALDRGGLPHASGDFVGTVTTMLGRATVRRMRNWSASDVRIGAWLLGIQKPAAFGTTHSKW
jgi:hypothetical protein